VIQTARAEPVRRARSNDRLQISSITSQAHRTEAGDPKPGGGRHSSAVVLRLHVRTWQMNDQRAARSRELQGQGLARGRDLPLEDPVTQRGFPVSYEHWARGIHFQWQVDAATRYAGPIGGDTRRVPSHENA